MSDLKNHETKGIDDKVVPMMPGSETTKMKLLDQWLKELIYPGDPKDFFKEISGQGSTKEVIRKFCFYTDEHKYNIIAVERSEDDSYLGCQVSTRKRRAGEDWSRGNDLPDGDFNKKTWDRIIYSIVSYEMVKLSKFKKPDTVPKDIA